MAVVTYRCDTCDRQIEFQHNKQGVEIMDRCTITLGCRGSLFPIEFNSLQAVSRTFPRDVEGLVNYTQRKVLFTHDQTFFAKLWNVKHNLNAIPTVQVHTFEPTQDGLSLELREVDPLEIIFIDGDNLDVRFAAARTGVAQCIARSANLDIIPNEPLPRAFTNATPGSELTIATLRHENVYHIIASFVNLKGTVETQITFEFTDATTIRSPWVHSKRVLINGKIYTARSVNIGNILANANIEDGASFYFKQQFINDTISTPPDAGLQPIGTDDVIILLSNPPFQQFDIDTRQYFTISNALNRTAGAQSLFFSQRELFVYEDKLVSTYPPIRTIVSK